VKKIIFLLVIIIAFSSFCSAQYKVNKELYDTCEYSRQVGDPFNPALMAFTSAVLPGVGQLFEGETARGMGFLGGFLTLFAVRQVSKYTRPENINYTQKDITRWATILGRNGLRVWSAFDAAHVAKINNLAFRAKYRSETGIKVFPYPDLPDRNFVSYGNIFGITLIVSF